MDRIIICKDINGFDFSLILNFNKKLNNLDAGNHLVFKINGEKAIKVLHRLLNDEEILLKLYPKRYLGEGKITHKKRIIRSLEVFGINIKKLNTRTSYDTFLKYTSDIMNNTMFIATANKVCELYKESNTYIETCVLPLYQYWRNKL